MMRNELQSLTIKGFKTIRDLESFEPRSLTVLLGPNGAGKSNFISFFRMMSWALSGPKGLALFVGQQGGAGKLLHDGSSTTREIEAELKIVTDAGENGYAFRLVFAAGDTLIFADERYRFSRKNHSAIAPWHETGAGHRAPQILALADEDQTAQVLRNILRKIVVYQFHNTASTARIRNKWNMQDNRWLKEDAANLAPVLLRLREDDGRCYRRIVATIRLILPFFSDFELEPNHDSLLLAWRESDTDEVFDPSQASDGMLRIIALVTLLLLPERDLPDVLILDEPELGLHPHAITIIGGLIRAAAARMQIILATQSLPLVRLLRSGRHRRRRAREARVQLPSIGFRRPRSMAERIFTLRALGEERPRRAAMMQTRLHFIVEGQTEEAFVRRILRLHLAEANVFSAVRCVMTSRRRGIKHRGGIRRYAQARRDITAWMSEDRNPDARFTTMFDLYRLPSDFPGYENASGSGDPYKRIGILEDALKEDISDDRFIPYLQLHEFEALLLSNPRELEAQFPDRRNEICRLIKMAASFESPELINDGTDTAPSKRIIHEIPEYESMKASAGPIVAEGIGLNILRSKCPHFGEWLGALEALSNGRKTTE